MDKEKLTNYLESLIPDLGIPSVDCVVYKNHEEIYRHMCGTVDADRTVPVSPTQKYIMFSMTKVMTMTAFMQLVEQGKISLEDEVSKFLPAYKNLKVETESGVTDLKTPLKMKHLVSMQSGLDYDLNRPGIVRVLKEKGMKATTREIVDSFPETPLKFEPGTRFLYSLSHDVVAAVIEVVSGMSFGEYLKKNVWEPLGIKNTFFAKPFNDDVEGLARQNMFYDIKDIRPMEQSCNYQLTECYESGGAGLISCTEDYARLADALACGGVGMTGARILKPETVEIFKNNLLGPASREDLRVNMGRIGYGYGVGMQIFMDPKEAHSTAPAGIFGWDGAAGSAIQMDTASATSFVFTMHVRNMGIVYFDVHPKLRDIIFGK